MNVVFYQHTNEGKVNRQIKAFSSMEKALVEFYGNMRASVNDTNIAYIACEITDDKGLVYKRDEFKRETQPQPSNEEQPSEEE
jgi:hypothetical protein